MTLKKHTVVSGRFTCQFSDRPLPWNFFSGDVVQFLKMLVICLFRQLGRVSSDACISRLAVDKHVYVSKTGSHTVEVWDKKNGRMVNLIDCMQLLG